MEWNYRERQDRRERGEIYFLNIFLISIGVWKVWKRNKKEKKKEMIIPMDILWFIEGKKESGKTENERMRTRLFVFQKKKACTCRSIHNLMYMKQWSDLLDIYDYCTWMHHILKTLCFPFHSMRLFPNTSLEQLWTFFFPCYLQNNHDSFETVSNGDKFRIFSFFFPFTFTDWIIYFTSIVYYSSYLSDLNNRFIKRKIDGFSKEYSF